MEKVCGSKSERCRDLTRQEGKIIDKRDEIMEEEEGGG